MNNKFEMALIQNNLSALSEQERLNYYNTVCTSLGLNPTTQPFTYITLNGKLVLYATRACTEQLRNIHKVSLEITKREQVNDVYVVTAKATLPDGRYDESTGAVNISNLKGDALANALMKTETKAKRRVTLSICGLAFLDESELDTIKDAIKTPPLIGSTKSRETNPEINSSASISTSPTPNAFAGCEKPDKFGPPEGTTMNDWHGNFFIGFGPFEGKQFDEVEPTELHEWVMSLVADIKKTKRKVMLDEMELMNAAKAYFKELEKETNLK